MKMPVNFSICLFIFLTLIIVSQQKQTQQEQRREEINVDNFAAKLIKRKRSLPTSEKLTGKSAFLNRRLHKREADPMEEQSCVVRVQKVETTVGKCVMLRGGIRGCQTDLHLDPESADCMIE
ncbi:hypothetical protein ACQ4LE_004531 [Meloidogyne hapla]|uniref:Astacin domain-containing protein n=1 Tax=Meloidogyne hapla TaxID=6305 RepID=A0A1I8B1V6_MELHA